MDGWEHIEIDCYVRAGTRPEPVNELVARLRNLAGTGTVAELTVHSWPSTVDLDTDVNDRYLDIYEQLDQWAASHDAQIQPPFSVRHIDSSITGETRRELVMPVLCLALSTSRELTGVFPHTVAGDTYAPHDVVDTLEAGDALDTLSHAIRPHHTTRTPKPLP
ncbi:HTH domain-containing protein [Haloarcula sp. JP-L23]|uniref:HTH domain-containing protein n=1 Tax=Haloarcula sp. JP-L23 TaxID=2716717 RepID=UPI003742CCA3